MGGGLGVGVTRQTLKSDLSNEPYQVVKERRSRRESYHLKYVVHRFLVTLEPSTLPRNLYLDITHTPNLLKHSSH